MAYKKHEWKARQGTGLNKFRDQDGKLYEFTSVPDSVTQPGTPFSAEWMNEMEDGIAAAGITYLTSTAGPNATAITITENAPEEIAAGDHFRIYFTNQVGANATLDINGTGPHPIINNYSGSAIAQGDIPENYVGDIMYDGENYVLLNALILSATPTGYAFYTGNGDFIVPNAVNAIKVSACAAGVGRYAGEYLIDRIFNVTPGQVINLTIGAGNTVIGDLITLIAGTVASSAHTTKLGYAAGYNGGAGALMSNGGFGGAFGFGGGGAAYSSSSSALGGGGGGGIGGDGQSGNSSSGGGGGGTTGGIGGTNLYYDSLNGGNSQSGSLIYTGALKDGRSGGDGSVYGAGGGAGKSKNEQVQCGGGAAGGYGAGCGGNGDSTYTADASRGMVLIEWGGTISE